MIDRVIDTSALALALAGKTAAAAGLRGRLSQTQCHAPHLIDAELGTVLRRHAHTGAISADQALTALSTARLLIDFRYPHTGRLAEHAWELRDNFSFYDALYVALAARLGIPLITGDKRLANAPRLACSVELIVDDAE